MNKLNLEASVVRKGYRVDITREQMLVLLKAEADIEFFCSNPTLDRRLNNIHGVSHVEYDGHFGASIYFDIDENDSVNLELCIRDINDQLLKCLEFLTKEKVNA